MYFVKVSPVTNVQAVKTKKHFIFNSSMPDAVKCSEIRTAQCKIGRKNKFEK